MVARHLPLHQRRRRRVGTSDLQLGKARTCPVAATCTGVPYRWMACQTFLKFRCCCSTAVSCCRHHALASRPHGHPRLCPSSLAASSQSAHLCRLGKGLGTQQRRWLRRWFHCGAAAGLAAACASVALLAGELRALLRAEPAGAGAAAGGPGPRLQLALPGVTLPGSHALPLWLALTASLAAHEVGAQSSATGVIKPVLLLQLPRLALLDAGLPPTHPVTPPPPPKAGHALAAATEGVHVSGAGLSLLLLLPAAFVELDSDDLVALDRAGMLRVATAGVWHNATLGLACWAALAALPAGASGRAATVVAAGALLPAVRLVLGYTVSLSVALALLNMAPVHRLDGQQALEAVLLRPRRPAKELPNHADPGGDSCSAAGRRTDRRAAVVRWVLHAGTAAYAAVVLLHVARVHQGS